MVFKILKTINGEWFIEIVSRNQRTLAQPESYWNRSDAVHAAQLIISEAGNGTIEG